MPCDLLVLPPSIAATLNPGPHARPVRSRITPSSVELRLRDPQRLQTANKNGLPDCTGDAGSVFRPVVVERDDTLRHEQDARGSNVRANVLVEM